MIRLGDIEKRKAVMLDQDQLNSRLIKAAQCGDAKALSQALAEGANAKASDSGALSWAAEGGHVECVRILIPVSDFLVHGSLSRAVFGGHSECVRLLIPVSDPMSNDSLALRQAARYGHTECVRLLLPVSDPLAMGKDELDAATLARNSGHMDAARMIEAFIEAKALSRQLDGAVHRPSSKMAL